MRISSQGKRSIRSTPDAEQGGSKKASSGAAKTVRQAPVAEKTKLNQGAPDDAASAANAAALAGPSATVGGGVPRFLVDGDGKKKRGPKSPPAPEVTALLELYGVSGRLGRPAERVAQWAATVQAGLVGETSPDALLDRVVKDNVRLGVFYLEGLLKLYRDRYGAPVEKQYEALKAFEDRLGAYSALQGFVKLAAEKGFPREVVTHLEEEQAKARDALKQEIEERWVPTGRARDRVPLLASLVDVLQGLDWDKYKDDRAYLVKEIRGELKQLKKSELDMRQLQGNEGLHELRRQLRWIPIYLTAVDGMVALDENKNSVRAYQPLLDTPIAESKYAKLPPSEREKDPILISKSLFLANTKYIEELGALKDIGENIETMAHALVATRQCASEAEATREAARRLGYGEGAFADVVEKAEAIYAELEERDLVGALRKELKGG